MSKNRQKVERQVPKELLEHTPIALAEALLAVCGDVSKSEPLSCVVLLFEDSGCSQVRGVHGEHKASIAGLLNKLADRYQREAATRR